MSRDFASMVAHILEAAPQARTAPGVLMPELLDIAARYKAPCAFKAGDLVTPRSNSGQKGAGHPHIVLEVIDWADPYLHHGSPKEKTSSAYGMRQNMRVAGEANPGRIACFWVESFTYEEYVPGVTKPPVSADDDQPADEVAEQMAEGAAEPQAEPVL